ncbi:MAG: hypothetical protein QOE61_4866, partial [Micromonosporaceae bacterium]|nr:hypothetical protein [Micromonosporaceae bacterium]
WDLATGLSQALLSRGTSSRRQRAMLHAGASDTEIVEAVVAETAMA